MTFDELKAKAHSLPLKPGVYIMRDSSDTVIYVGKAKALRNRVSQYFYDLASHGPKTRAMVSCIDHFDVFVVNSEFEALVLESQQIKRYQPKYNILLKDDKGYPYIRADLHERYPQFTLATRTADDGARYFGPFGSRGTTTRIIDAVLRALNLPTCGKKFPRDIGKERPCLNHQMGYCPAWCQGGDSCGEEEYRAAITQAVALLEGKYAEVSAELEQEMLAAAEELRFEHAAELRDRIRAIEQLGTRQKVAAITRADTDAVGFFMGEAKSCFVVLHYASGGLAAKDYETFETPVEVAPEELLAAVLPQYYLSRGILPREILLPAETGDEEELEQLLTERAGRKVLVHVPKRGDKTELTKLACRNAEEEVIRQTTKEERQSKTVELLGHMLRLPETPDRMESYDISNTGSSDIVASMVVFSKGRPLKRDYRRFILKDMPHPDDYASMEQVLTRRFQRYLDGDEKFAPLPDLLLIDGGLTHANVAVKVLNELHLQVPVFGMVKDDRHRTRALIAPSGEEIGIRQYPAVFAMIGQIQEEVHRFAITFHHERHSKSAVHSQLDGIPNVGEKRKQELLKHFKTVKAIKAASVEQLGEVLPKNAAQAVYTHFHGEGETEQ